MFDRRVFLSLFLAVFSRWFSWQTGVQAKQPEIQTGPPQTPRQILETFWQEDR